MRADPPRADAARPDALAGDASRSRPGGSAPVRSVEAPRGRYFFAASEDWNREAGRSIVPLGRGVLGASVVPPSPREAREHSGPSGVGSVAVRDGFVRDPKSSTREALSSLARDVPRDATPAVMVARDHVASMLDETARRASSQPTVKGTVVTGAIEHLETAHGAAKLEQILARLEPATRSKLAGVVLPMAWLPLPVLEGLLRAAESAIGDVSVGESVGRGCADRELPTTHRLFMQTATPTAAVERLPLLYRAYFGRGEARVMSSGPNGARVMFDQGSEMPMTASFLLGFTQRLLELTGGRDVRVTRGDERDSLFLRWR